MMLHKSSRVMDKNPVFHKGLKLACKQLSIDRASDMYKDMFLTDEVFIAYTFQHNSADTGLILRRT